MPEQLVTQLTSSHFVAFGVGAVLLVFGRKLFWLAIGGLGFLFGVGLANQVLHLSSAMLELGIGLVIGIGCAFLAVFAQKLAVAFAGFVLGGAGALWAASFFEASLEGRPDVLLLAIALVGAILGVFLAPKLFEVSLTAVTSLVGALLIASQSGLGSPRETWLFAGLLAVGMIVQTMGRRKRARRVHVVRPAER